MSPTDKNCNLNILSGIDISSIGRTFPMVKMFSLKKVGNPQRSSALTSINEALFTKAQMVFKQIAYEKVNLKWSYTTISFRKVTQHDPCKLG